MTKANFITTSIPYVNAKPHVGFALELVQADTVSRYRRLKGEDVVFQTGTDENSLKTLLAAKNRGVSIHSHVLEHAELYKELSARLRISINQFVQTSSDHHRSIVQNFWRRIHPEDIYRKGYGGFYCVGCEDFLTDSDLVDGKCPDHQKAPEFIKEENYFFRLSKYQQQLIDLIECGRIRIAPSFRKKEILNFIEGGLEDISISRDQSRSEGWGIPVPGDESQIIYVWIDALINYVSGGSDDEQGFARIWNANTEKFHFIGKNVWKFHAIYWPALLLSAGLALPDEIVIHGFLTVDGKKISKSLGNAVDPVEVIEIFGGDTLRFYLLRCCSPFEDSDFSLAALKNAHNTYLVNGLGNLVSRLKALAEKSEVHATAITGKENSFPEVDEAVAAYRFDDALKYLWREIDRINGEIAGEKPWESLSSERTGVIVARWLVELARITYWLGAFLPDASDRAKLQLYDPGADSFHLFNRIT